MYISTDTYTKICTYTYCALHSCPLGIIRLLVPRVGLVPLTSLGKHTHTLYIFFWGGVHLNGEKFEAYEYFKNIELIKKKHANCRNYRYIVFLEI